MKYISLLLYTKYEGIRVGETEKVWKRYLKITFESLPSLFVFIKELLCKYTRDDDDDDFW